MQTNLEKAKIYAARLLSYRSRSEYELRTRLRKSGYEYEVIEGVMKFLKDYNYINDLEFAKQWVSNRLALKPMGQIRLSWELRQKGIEVDIIDNVLNGFDEDEEYKIAVELVKKKYMKCNKCSVSKIASFLQRRGFSSSIVVKICSNIEAYKYGQ